MVRRNLLSVFVVVMVACWSCLGQAQDLRDTLGTRSTDAAEALSAGIKLVEQKKPSEALILIEKAIAADPDFQMAYYWKALACTDLGDIDAAFVQYEKIVEISQRTKISNISVDACINAGLTVIQTKQAKGPCEWFTRAIMLDPNDTHKLRWKAFRNMAIWRFDQKDHLTATLCAMSAYAADPRRVDLRMVAEFLSKVEQEEVAKVLDFGGVPFKITARTEPNQLVEADALPAMNEVGPSLIPDPLGKPCIGVYGRQT